MQFCHRLAATLGTTVKRLGDEMDSDEFTYWYAFNAVEPIGDGKLDLLAGKLGLVIAQAHRFEKRDGTPLCASDFMFRYWDQEPKLDRETVAAKVRLALNRVARKFSGGNQ